jgi:hypothetical protein
MSASASSSSTSLFTAAAAAASSTASAATSTNSILSNTPRILQSTSDTYTYLNDLSSYSLSYSSCIRVKIPEENDDDTVEGYANFYNGKYHARYAMYVTFHVCDTSNYNKNTQCGTCDYNAEYALEASEYLETTMEYWQNYCNECQNACGGRRLSSPNFMMGRELEDNNGVNCNTCSNECNTYNKGGDNNNDESAYTECQAAYQEDGMQLYYGPMCSDSGEIVIGVFYDEDCSIKTKYDAPALNYYKFSTVQSNCLSCASNGGNNNNGEGGSCTNLYGNAFHCVNGKDKTGKNDEMSVCSTVKKALTSVDYSGVKKRSSGNGFLKVFFALLAISFVGAVVFLTYAYYIRHRGEKSQPMLSSEDVHEPESRADGGTLT